MCSPEAYDLAQVLLKLVQLPIHLPDHTVNPLFTSVSSKLHTMPNPEEIRNKSVVNECFSKSVHLSKHSCKPVQSGVTLNWKVFRKDFWWRPFYFFLWWGQSQARPLGRMCVGEVRSKAPRARLTITSEKQLWVCLASVSFAIRGRLLPPLAASLLPSSCNGNKPQLPTPCPPPARLWARGFLLLLPTSALSRSDPTALLLLFYKSESLKFILFLPRSFTETPAWGPSQKRWRPGHKGTL